MSLSIAMLEIVACAATAATTTYLIVESRERRQFLYSKAEELYTLVEAADAEMTEYFAEAYPAFADNKPAPPRAEASLARARQCATKIRMLVGFYFPAVRAPLKATDNAAAAALTASRACGIGDADENALLRLDHDVIEMKDSYEALKYAVVSAHRDGRGRLFSLRRPMSTAPETRSLRMAT